MLEKITDYEYAQIESAINGILGIRNNISQYILDSLFQSAESFNKNWKGEAETLFVGKLELLYNAISDTNTAAYNMAVTDVLEQASIMPVKYISRVEKALQKINASSENTVCIDFCTGNDAAVLTTMYSILEKKKISLTGGTGDGGKVSVNGTVYTDADVFAFVKNNGGKVRVYKENIYYPNPQYRFIASKTDRSKYTVGELNGKPARQAYQDTLGIREQDIVNQTFKNPLGKKNGKDICIISIREVAGNGLRCYRQVNDSDVLYLLETNDYPSIVEETVRQIKGDFGRISGIFSINCIFRYLFFSQERYMDQYLKTMGTLGMHAGLVGFGEHYNSQFVNQTMSCVVFE